MTARWDLEPWDLGRWHLEISRTLFPSVRLADRPMGLTLMGLIEQ